MKRMYSLFTITVAAFALLISSPIQSMAERVGDRTGAVRGQNDNNAAQATQNNEGAETMQAASALIRDMMQGSPQGIPSDVLQNAAGIAIIPNMVKAGFIAAGRHGQGVLLTHKGNEWSLPVFMSISGGSLGLQAGVETSDVVLVFQNARSMDNLIAGNFNLGADAIVAAGPAGAAAKASTSNADILSYKRTGGLFAGVSVTGGVLSLDREATRDFYNTQQRSATGYYPTVDDILTMKRGAAEGLQEPASAKELQQLVTQYTSSKNSVNKQ